MNIKDYLNELLPYQMKATNTRKKFHWKIGEPFTDKEWIDLTLEMLKNSDQYSLDEMVAKQMYKKYLKYMRYGNLIPYDRYDLSMMILGSWSEYAKKFFPNHLSVFPSKRIKAPEPILPSTFGELFEVC